MLLRQDNADYRLTEKGYGLGLAGEERMRRTEEKYRQRDEILEFIEKYSVKPGEVNKMLEERGTTPLRQGVKLRDVVLRPQVRLKDIIENIKELKGKIKSIPEKEREALLEAVEIAIKYGGYINREKAMAEKLKRLENIKIKKEIDYSKLLSLSTEARQKLEKIRPDTIAEASRISGVSPADIGVLLVYMGR